MVESGSNELYLSTSYATITKNLNKIFLYYDFGNIQYKDIEGKEWKVVYSE